MQITSAALFIAISLVVFGISYYYFTTRHRERMTLLEKGLPPDYFKNSVGYLPFLLVLGIISIGIALGILTATFLKSSGLLISADFVLPASVFIFLGISFLVSYYVLRRHYNK